MGFVSRFPPGISPLSAFLPVSPYRLTELFVSSGLPPRKQPGLLTAHVDISRHSRTDDVGTRFGRRLRMLRQERRMTQGDMAKKFGIDRSYISDVERGRKSMTLSMLEVIAIGMNVSLSKLFEDL